jgi:dihydroneopterin aldolase
MRGKIALEGLSFYGYHGYYTEENVIGNQFTVDLIVTTFFDTKADELEGTVNYENLYKAAKEVMDVPTKLLETLAGKIAEKILNENEGVEDITVKVKKHHPPIGGTCQHAYVEITQSR